MTPAKKPAAQPETFTAEERAAMKDRAREVRGEDGLGPEEQVLAKIAAMDGHDRHLAERLHALVAEVAPDLVPKLWYGMPAYARKGRVVVFFQSAARFRTRYATLGFSDQAHLDDGGFWPTSYALGELTAEDEKKLAALIRQAAG